MALAMSSMSLALTLIAVLMLWWRIGKVRDTISFHLATIRGMVDDVNKLLASTQGVALSTEIHELRGEIRSLHSRLLPLEQERSHFRRETIETNQKVLDAMNALREEWQLQHGELANRVVAEVMKQSEAQIRRIARDEVYRLRGEDQVS
jgi:polyhydroxyalkanoate synthesis regulator phasin